MTTIAIDKNTPSSVNVQTGEANQSSALAPGADRVNEDDSNASGDVGGDNHGDLATDNDNGVDARVGHCSDGLCTTRVSVVLRVNARRVTRKPKPGRMEVLLIALFRGPV